MNFGNDDINASTLQLCSSSSDQSYHPLSAEEIKKDTNFESGTNFKTDIF
jgi:hypothetical protein